MSLHSEPKYDIYIKYSSMVAFHSGKVASKDTLEEAIEYVRVFKEGRNPISFVTFTIVKTISEVVYEETNGPFKL